MNRPPFAEAAQLWVCDGSLRDVYVLGTSEADWASLLVLAREHQATYWFEGADGVLPEPKTIFARREGTHQLEIQLRDVQVRCNFFVPEEIELDIDPRQVSDVARHEAVLDFVEELAQRVRKPVLLTPENTPAAPLLSYDPLSNQWAMHPDRSIQPQDADVRAALHGKRQS